MQRSENALMPRGRKWELLHSLWIGWTFTLGFFGWVAFVYIGLRTQHMRWVLWGLLYAAPFTLFLFVVGYVSQGWANQILNATALVGLVAIVHAFLVRKEYLLRLQLHQQETSNVSVTTRGRRWELKHSLWIILTFTLVLNWLAFIIIGIVVRRGRWVLWGLLYSLPFIISVFAPKTAGPANDLGDAMFPLIIVGGVASIVHAFLIREDYLMRLENRMQEAAETDARRRRRLEAEHRSKAVDAPQRDPEPLEPAASPAISSSPKKPDTQEKAATSLPNTRPTLAPVEAEAASSSKMNESLHRDSILDTYPLPIAFSWSLLASFWDPRDRYREQLRHAENMLAYLGSLSLALLKEQDYEETEVDLKVPWQGGISFGGWKEIVQRSAKVFRTYEAYKDHPLAADIRRLNIGSEKKGFGADVAALIRVRNDYHHGRGPTIEEEIVIASNEAQERLQRCMEALSFLTQYSIRLVQDFDVDRRSGGFLLKCLRLVGDGPGFSQEKVVFPEALPRGDLYLDLGNQSWVSLYPFVAASNCPFCRYRETYFVDRWNDRKGTALMKSFERGHTEERRDISDSLSALTGDRQEPKV